MSSKDIKINSPAPSNSLAVTNSEPKGEVSEESWVDEGKELKRISRKVDFRIIPIVITIYVCNFLDRVNIGYARLYQLENDLNLTQAEYSWSLSIFFFGYILFEIPSNLMLKKAKPSRWIARIMISWGIISASFAAVRNFSGMLAARFFLGIAEAGMSPGLIFYLSFWYTRKQQAIRLSLFLSASSLSAIIAGPLAHGLSKLNSLGGLKPWQWIFIMEGLPSIILGFVVYWLLPNSPSEVKWLTSHEQSFLLKRLARDHIDPEDCKINWKEFKRAFMDYKVYVFMLLQFALACPTLCTLQLLPTIINSMGFNTSETMLLTIPPYVTSMIMNILLGWHSDRTRERCFHLILPLSLAVIGYTMLSLVQTQTPKYIACYLAAVGVISPLPMVLAWFNNTMVGSTKSATATAMVVSFANIGGIISGQLYRNNEAPYYIQSNMVCLSCVLLVMVISITLRALLKRENDKLDQIESSQLGIEINSRLQLNRFRYTL